MIATIKLNSRNYTIDLNQPLDISIPLLANGRNVRAWYAHEPSIQPFESEGFIGSIAQGAAVNFRNIAFNPHAHITHTECVGHITEKVFSVNQHLQTYFHLAELVTVAPEKQGDDFVISKKQLQYAIGNKKRSAIVIRTIPNTSDKLARDYSGSNPPYLMPDAARYLVDKGVEHLLIDLPSVDRESDGGALLSHKIFWQVDGQIRKNATITELIFVPNKVGDGTYFLNLQVAPIENDASPSRPVLYQIL